MNGPKEHLENVELALRLWNERVKPEDVVPELGKWVCGTQACFGGHLATWPEFQALGVHPSSCGSPGLVDCSSGMGRWLTASETGMDLFGDLEIFAGRGGHPADPDFGDCTLTDHQVVVNRLNWRLSTIERQLKDV